MLNINVRRNLSGVLSVIGAFIVAARLWSVVMSPDSGRAWFELCGAVVITCLCLDSFFIYRRKSASQESRLMGDGE